MAQKSWSSLLTEAFAGKKPGGKPKPFPLSMKEFLHLPIEFRVPGHNPLFLIIEAIQPIATEVDYQLLLRFQLAEHPPAPGHKPTIGHVNDFQRTERTYFGEDEDRPVFWYTLTSLNSHDQNKENLRSFAIANWNVEDDDIKIAGDLTDREHRLIRD